MVGNEANRKHTMSSERNNNADDNLTRLNKLKINLVNK